MPIRDRPQRQIILSLHEYQLTLSYFQDLLASKMQFMWMTNENNELKI